MAQKDLLLQPDRFECDLRRDEWVAIPVAADPGAELHRGDVRRQSQRELLRQLLLQLPAKERKGVEEHCLHIVERVADLIEDRWAAAADLVRGPEELNLSGESLS